MEIKASIDCIKCKTGYMKSVAKLRGIDKMEIDEAKGVMTVIGAVDPCQIVRQIRKKNRFAKIISVGDPESTEPAENPEPEPEPEPEPNPLPPCCDSCRLVSINFVEYPGVPGCSIL